MNHPRKLSENRNYYQLLWQHTGADIFLGYQILEIFKQ